MLAWSAQPLANTGNTRQSVVQEQHQGLEQVVTSATRLQSDPLDYIGSISALSEEALALVSHTHVQESLLRVPGVNMNRGEGQEYLPAIRSPVLTGSGACGGFLMAEDGIPLRAAGFCNINELFDAHTEMAQRIEVLRGPGTALYGSNALHGVINVITPDLSRDDSVLGLEAGPYDFGRIKLRTATDLGQASRLGVSLSLTHNDGYRDASGVDQQKLSLRHRYEAEQWNLESGLTATNLEQETAGYISGLDAYKDSALARSNPNPEAYRDSQSLRLWSRLTYQLDEHRSLVVTPYARHTDMDFLMHFLPGSPLEENSQQSVGVQSAYYIAAADDLNIITGIDAEFTQGDLQQTQAEPTQGSAFLQATIPSGKQYDYDVDATMVAPFAQLDWSFANAWMLSLGLRYEWMQYDYSNNMNSGRVSEDGSACGFGGCRYSRPESGTDSFRNWSPKLGLSYAFSDTQMAYMSLARGFRAPQTSELYRLQRSQQVTDLDSEQVDSLELGIKGTIESLQYAVALYAMEKDNYIFRDADFFNVSDGETDHRGVEVEANYRINSAWDVGVSASYSKHTYAYDELLDGINIRDNDVDTAPRHFGSARLGWNFQPGSRVELEWQHVGAYYLDAENLHEYEGHDLLNMRVSWQPASDWKVYARALNLTDRAYAERADYTTFTDERYFPGTPRSFYAGVEFMW
ncbi:TonB-dependent receptor [Pseudomaricurvus alcaniphilus]|nr:TonB-dependent receptor [Pseudomaricurvus alcaniphilus]